MSSNEQWLTIPQYAEARNVSAGTVWAWIREGRLTARRISRRVTRLAPEDITKFEASLQTESFSRADPIRRA